MGGAHVFLTGAPGAGKTYVLNEYVQRAKKTGKVVAVTASTGIAATHLNGNTIHAWSGLGIRDFLTPDDERWLAGNEKLIKRYNGTDVLVIDEVSMLHGARLNMINQAAKLLRKSDAPFGGLQVILVGDLYQLPPVSRYGMAVDFVHDSAAWHELDPEVCYITEQHRQADSDQLLNLLQAMRRDQVDTEHFEMLQERTGLKASDGEAVTRLFAHNVDVEAINNTHLAALMTKSRTYTMTTKGAKQRVEQLTKSLLAPEKLELKIGAEVMFVANNFAEGYVNGSRGRVLDFRDDGPLVELLNGRKMVVEPFTWNLTEDGRSIAEARQLPLRLAWAITIHKSQGMSLDAAEIDLSKAFTPGMGYVALSRVRSLDGLYLKGINNMALAMHPQIHSFDGLLRQASAELAAVTEDIEDQPVVEETVADVVIDEALFEKLKDWRFQRAKADGVPAFMIAHNATLTAVVLERPVSTQQLLQVPGFGSRKAEAYGADIVKIVVDHQS
ncbi:MAG: helicase [Candidatus Saccharibacteria bacterium]|nr:helicase [Candidatus Saccharibacteria bacterium]